MHPSVLFVHVNVACDTFIFWNTMNESMDPEAPFIIECDHSACSCPRIIIIGRLGIMHTRVLFDSFFAIDNLNQIEKNSPHTFTHSSCVLTTVALFLSYSVLWNRSFKNPLRKYLLSTWTLLSNIFMHCKWSIVLSQVDLLNIHLLFDSFFDAVDHLNQIETSLLS